MRTLVMQVNIASALFLPFELIQGRASEVAYNTEALLNEPLCVFSLPRKAPCPVQHFSKIFKIPAAHAHFHSNRLRGEISVVGLTMLHR